MKFKEEDENGALWDIHIWSEVHQMTKQGIDVIIDVEEGYVPALAVTNNVEAQKRKLKNVDVTISVMT